ncbi:glycosyl transferase [Terriglobus roseus DSM 18391]|uniref:Glycosyl transferase n=1 Tax=Terriglobus roseus (strain DSM 18391 / NRRL B-41598 / KBS 63) TaxID=926566 RepID=I3ZIP1_TERRK|nr:glucoamylase family protein [Terriglobus roseus]AFL89109.1 glycosyl transferase [Terriglobus roseus DSM 18391]
MPEVQGEAPFHQPEFIAETHETAGIPEEPSVSEDAFRLTASELVSAWQGAGKLEKTGADIGHRMQKLQTRLTSRLAECKKIATPNVLTPQLELLESTRMLQNVLEGARDEEKPFRQLTAMDTREGDRVPRVMRVTEEYLDTAGGIWSMESLAVFLRAVQEREALHLSEIRSLPVFLKLAQLEFILDRADETFAKEVPPIEASPFSAPLHSLRRLNQFEWPEALEQFVAFSSVLAGDPDGVFPRMEEETRGRYMTRVSQLAKHSRLSEYDVALTAIELSIKAYEESGEDPRLVRRRSHVGYYLFEEGLPNLSARIGYHAPLREHLRLGMKRYADDVYIVSIFFLTALTVAALTLPLVPHHAFQWTMTALFLALLPVTQGAIDIVNNIVTSLLEPQPLPKLDYTTGIPQSESTFVVVPTLLLSEVQVLELFEELEARWLANTDPHLHFGLLTDLPDSVTRPLSEDRNDLVDLAVRLTDELNAKYSHEGGGAFLLLHRHRVFNQRQGAWMGWERKRGKLLDLNKLLFGEFDSFPVKAGPTHLLREIRYVITLDSDTQLPKNTAARMVGTMAHPLNQGIVDPQLRVVTKGYGILQPRVAVSVASASRSRLAAIYSGETGFDIYTRAVSDVYQDLFGEGIFTGKGIYEAGILHEVLNKRFPQDVLLSHDLIEGAYARAGLVTDIEVVDDYPSHYSAYNRRKHRWVRGDWQIARWLRNRVPDESNRLGANPISLISQWKILDNLRRSLVEPITFLLIVCGWLLLPGGPKYWTIATLVLILFPVVVQLVFKLLRAAVNTSWDGCVDAVETFYRSLGFQLLNLAFLPHQTMLSVDAIVRSLVRTMVTGRKLLEWETAAQAETVRTRSALDVYLQASPLLAFAIGGLIALREPGNLRWTAPILFLWIIAPFVTGWLNSPPRKLEGPLDASDRRFVQKHALLIWRFFAEFGGEENHWLIPDNVEEQNLHQVHTLSPTNLGMLLNARQAALTLGFISLPEFTRATLGTLDTYSRLEKVNGHIYNWIDIQTLEAKPPFTISTVDSGNLLASFYALHGGVLDTMKKPFLTEDPFVALHAMMQAEGGSLPSDLRGAVKWLFHLDPVRPNGDWMMEEAERRRVALRIYVEQYLPWLLPRFEPLLSLDHFRHPENDVIPTLNCAVDYIRACAQRIDGFARAATGSDEELTLELRTLLSTAEANAVNLLSQMTAISELSERYANEMHFGFLLVKARQLLSIGYDGKTQELHSACYDLLASEARIATFLAIAKGDVPQRVWFRLGRAHVLVKGRATLLSWTGTMFEYLMPTLWMRHYHDTLMSRAIDSAVVIQRNHVKRIPWGISESGMARKDAAGRFGYQAYGIPSLALKYGAEDGPVISPYSTFLALPFLRQGAIKNLRKMEKMGWVGSHGFFEAADFTSGNKQPELVRSWMAHHHGMSLLAATNLLSKNAVQSWFHANPRVRAAELLLHERPLGRAALRKLEKTTA